MINESRVEAINPVAASSLLVPVSEVVVPADVHDEPVTDTAPDGALGGVGGSAPKAAPLGNPGPGFFLPPLVAAGRRASMSSPTLLPGSSSPGRVAAQSLLKIVSNAEGGEEKWLLREISNFNAPVKRRCFPKKSSALLR